MGEAGGGIANALIGSIIIVLTASVIAIPIGILAGIYLSENKTGKLAYWARLSVDVLQGVPSIVIGIVVYFWVVKPIGDFFRFVRQCGTGHYDAADLDSLYGRNAEDDTIFLKGSGACARACLTIK